MKRSYKFLLAPINGISALTKLFSAIKPQKIISFLLTLLFMLSVAITSLDVFAAAAPAPNGKAPNAAKAPGASAKPDWQQKWDSVLVQAKQEGSVNIIVSDWLSPIRGLIVPAFKKRYGLDLDITPTGRGAQMVTKIKAEQSAGLYSYDLFGGGSTTALNILKPQGLLGSLEPFLILPDVKDPKSWMGGRLPFIGKEKFFFGMAAAKQQYLIYNTDLIKNGEITSYKDTLKPQYAGKITLNDPSTGGSGCALFAHLALDIWDEAETRDFLRKLLVQQKAFIESDNRIHVESVARGKFAIGLGTSPGVVAQYIQNGAPIAAVISKEGTNVTSGGGGLGIPIKMAHPNAGVVFLNWLLSKEGQSLFAKGWGTPSLRLDASTEGIDPLFLIQPGEKLFLPSEEKSLAMGDWMGISKQIIEGGGK